MPRVAADLDGIRAFGRHISARRALLEMTQEQVAEACGTDRAHLSLIERGRGNPSLELILRIATALDISAGDLIDGRDLAQSGLTSR